MNKINVAQLAKTASLLPPAQGLLQRKCACGNHTVVGGECAECAKKKTGLQRKLTIGASNDPLEREADRIADQVMAAPSHSAVSGAPLHIQRYTGLVSGEMDTAPGSVDLVLANSGRPLDPALRQDMESRFGHDFSQVRVHLGDVAEQSAREVNAHAYTVGHNIVFGAGKFAPRTHEGRRLLAHELTHVVQQANQLPIAVNAQVSTVYDPVKVPSSSPNRTLARETDPQSPTKNEQKTDLKATRLARFPGEAIIQWKALSLNEQRLVLIRMTGMYGADFAAAFLPYAQGKKKPNISTSIETDNASSTLVARGFRYAGNVGGTPTWVHPSGLEVKLVAKGRDLDDCRNLCSDTTGEDECVACCEEKIDPNNLECLSSCKTNCAAKEVDRLD